MANVSRSLMLFGTLSLALCLGMLGLPAGCKCTQEPASIPPKTPSIRLYLISSISGALEPCGCVKDMLGGIDHAAAYMLSHADEAPNRLALGAGPLLFMDL